MSRKISYKTLYGFDPVISRSGKIHFTQTIQCSKSNQTIYVIISEHHKQTLLYTNIRRSSQLYIFFINIKSPWKVKIEANSIQLALFGLLKRWIFLLSIIKWARFLMFTYMTFMLCCEYVSDIINQLYVFQCR